MKNHNKIMLLAAASLLLATPLMAWYYFTASNGQRQQWVFGKSCNAAARPIKILVDADTPSNFRAVIAPGADTILEQWNTPFDLTVNLFDTNISAGTTMDLTAVYSFLDSPVPNQVWIVYDKDGGLFSALGLDNLQILGVGIPLSLNDSRPADICSGIMLVNGYLINRTFTKPEEEFKKTVLHELGHVLGLAHSIVGHNGQLQKVSNYSQLPVMFPFSILNATGGTINSGLLTNDDMAAIIAIYGE